jgi:hypothetical protein
MWFRRRVSFEADQNLPVVLVVVRASSVSDAITEDHQRARVGWYVGLYGADEVPRALSVLQILYRVSHKTYQCTLEVPVKAVALTLLPLTNQLVVLLPG